MDIYGKARVGDSAFCPWGFQNQYYDTETGLAYNRFRYYDPGTGGYISKDPIGLSGGDNVYAYVLNSNLQIDPMGLIPLNQEGFFVYGLYEQGAKEPYYVGISNNTDAREIQHFNSGRMRGNDELILLEKKSMKYAEARGKEQMYIEEHNTKTGKRGQALSEDGLTAKQRGNKNNSFDKTRTDRRGKAFKNEYDKAKKPKFNNLEIKYKQ